MKFYLAVTLLVLAVFYSCNNSDKKENVEVEKQADTTAPITVRKYLKTDFPDRVFEFKKMPDAVIEDQIIKYEKFSVLFIEYMEIENKFPLYAPEDQVHNREAYNALRDEMFSLKEKLRKNMTVISKSQEARLDTADAHMNKFLPQVYK